MKMAVFWVVAPRRLVSVYRRFVALMMEAVQISETLLNLHQSTRRYNQKTAIFILTTVKTSNHTKEE
jgi:hypothetical protein